MFHKVIEYEFNALPNMTVIHREAVRAVIFSEGKILLVQSNKGDYKFPGGGVEQGEGHKEALIREIAEETGYVECVVGEKLGEVVERRHDLFVDNAIFTMTSHYYMCHLVTPNKADQQLDDYELELVFKPVWVAIEDAIEKNAKLMNDPNANGWIQRENDMLELLAEILV